MILKKQKKIVLIVVTSIIGAVLLALLIFSATLFIMRERGKASFGSSPAPDLNDFIESANDINDNDKGEDNPQNRTLITIFIMMGVIINIIATS